MNSVPASRVLVWLLALWAAADGLGRLAPVGWLHILPEHVATRRPGRYAPFIPNLSLSEDPRVGETALTGNLPPREHRAAVRFSTDELGFRLTPRVRPADDVDLILYSGASFAYGGGLSDDETFPAVFTRTTGIRMYNGGHFWWDPVTLESLDWLIDHLHGRRSGVVMLYWEDLELQPSKLVTSNRAARYLRPILGNRLSVAVGGDWEYARRYTTALWNISPLEVESVRLFKMISNDRILPNQYKAAVLEDRLPNGEDLLFLEEEANRVIHQPDDADVRRHAEYFETVARHLAARNMKTYVILIPNKFSLYGPLVDPTAVAGSTYLDRLDQMLSTRGVCVLNATPTLRRYAAADVASGDLSFYREDHHWQPRGVERVVDAFAAYLKTN